MFTKLGGFLSFGARGERHMGTAIGSCVDFPENSQVR